MKITRRQLRRIIKEALDMAKLTSLNFDGPGRSYSGTPSGGIVVGTVDPAPSVPATSESDGVDEDEEVIDEDEDETEENK